MKTKIAVIGAGPAGLAAAAQAARSGIDDIIIIERAGEPGGILNQCIHNGFGLHTFKEELTGPEYAARYEEQVKELGIPYMLNTMVVDINDKKQITCMNRDEGMFVIEAQAIILAMGCRERPRGALNIPGYRPAGIYSAGTAQRFVNIEGRMPGKKVVILGSGDIGLIMARRMTFEGAEVKVVAELMPYSGGLKRNIVQCLDDYGIPLKLSHTVVDIRGRDRVEGVTIAAVDENLKPIPGTEEDYECDTLLLSCGLIPENELSDRIGISIHPVTNGPVVNESLETSLEGVFACGNVLHVHDLVDYVSEEAAAAGKYAAEYVKRRGGEMAQEAKLCAGKPAVDEEQYSGEPAADENQCSGKKAAKANQRPGTMAAEGMESSLPAGFFRDVPDEGIENAGHIGNEKENAAADACANAGLPEVEIVSGEGVRYTVPARIRVSRMAGRQIVRFRVGNVYKDARLCVYYNDECVSRVKKRVMAPGEMEQVILRKEDLESAEGLKTITIRVE